MGSSHQIQKLHTVILQVAARSSLGHEGRVLVEELNNYTFAIFRKFCQLHKQTCVLNFSSKKGSKLLISQAVWLMESTELVSPLPLELEAYEAKCLWIQITEKGSLTLHKNMTEWEGNMAVFQHVW